MEYDDSAIIFLVTTIALTLLTILGILLYPIIGWWLLLVIGIILFIGFILGILFREMIY